MKRKNFEKHIWRENNLTNKNTQKEIHSRKTHKHQLYEHLEHIWAQIHARSIREVLVNVAKGAGGSQEGVDRLVESSGGQAILLGRQLRVERAGVEQNRGLLEGDRTLTARHTRQRIEPLEVDPETSVGRKETPLDVIELVVVTQEQRDPCRVSGRRPRGLPITNINTYDELDKKLYKK